MNDKILIVYGWRYLMKSFNCSIWHHTLQNFKYCDKILAKLKFLLLEDDDIRYHFKKKFIEWILPLTNRYQNSYT